MRKIVIVSVAIVATVALGFGVLLREGVFERAKREKVQPRTTEVAEAKGTSTAAAMNQLVASQLARADLTNPKLEALEQRLRTLEAARAEEAAAKEVADSDSIKLADGSKLLKEDALGNWMLDKLRRNGNRDWTRQAETQIKQRLSALPGGLQVEAVECGDRFGRVTIFSKDGTQPDVVQLLGLPPFENESFTAPNEDGSVSIYFTAPGVKVEELRSEAARAAG